MVEVCEGAPMSVSGWVRVSVGVTRCKDERDAL